MKALPQKFSERWVQAKADPEGKVRFLVRPMGNRIRQHIQTLTVTWEETGECNACGQRLYKKIVDGAAASYETVGFGLLALEGLLEENGCTFTLDTKQVKLGNKSLPRVTDDCIDRLPALLFEEIMAEVNLSSTMSEEEIENLKNSLDSASLNLPDVSIAAGTSQDACTTAPTEG